MIKRIIFIFLLFVLVGCNSDNSKNLGGGYTLERTNACCIFIFNKNLPPIQDGKNIIYDNRIIKPIIKKLYIDDGKIVGLKESNKCCYLTEYEKKHNTKNGYFIIYKKENRVLTGLTTKELKDLNISLNKMKKVL